MNNYKIITTVFLIGITYMPIFSQTERKIEPARLKEITYLPLTEREGKNLNLPIPPGEHPRLFFRAKDIPALRAKLTDPLLNQCWEKIEANALYPTEGTLPGGKIHNLDLKVLHAIEARAFLYAFTNDKIKGEQAVDFIFNLNNTLIINPEKPDVCRDIGRVILSTAMVYDWCYNLLHESEKEALIHIMESLATDMEIQWPYLKQNSVCGHGVEAQLARDMLACAIAVYDEKPEIYQRAAGRIFAEFIPAQNFSYQSGHHHQGNAYGPGRFQWEVYTTLLFDRMGYPGIVDKKQGQMPYYWIYTRRPDGQLLRDGDDYCEIYNSFGEYWTLPGLPYLASYYKDPYLMNEAIKQKSIGKDPLIDFLLVEPQVPALNNTADLPLTCYFPYPYGGMVARTGWDDSLESNAVIAEMKAAEYNFVNHQHMDAGSFQLYYKGPLAVQSGIYQGSAGGYGGPHFINYYQRTIAHNCLLVYNPEEEFYWHQRPIRNEGGQRIPGGGSEPANLDYLLNGNYRMAEVLAHSFGPDSIRPAYSYLKADLTRAYTEKVKKHVRSFVFLNLNHPYVPGALIVYDHVISSNKEFPKTWLLHCVQEPHIDANICHILRNEKGYNGKLINTALLPEPGNLHIRKVGGKQNEYSVNQINYPQSFIPENNSGDGAIWRIEISPKKPSETNNFLNVMQVMDANEQATPLTTEKIEVEEMVGTRIGNNIVLFNKHGLKTKNPVKLKIEGNHPVKILLLDMENGEWEISCKKTKHIINFTNGCLYFDALPGEYKFQKNNN